MFGFLFPIMEELGYWLKEVKDTSVELNYSIKVFSLIFFYTSNMICFKQIDRRAGGGICTI